MESSWRKRVVRFGLGHFLSTLLFFQEVSRQGVPDAYSYYHGAAYHIYSALMVGYIPFNSEPTQTLPPVSCFSVDIQSQ